MLRLWLTTLNHQERKYAHWAKNSKAVQKSSAAGQPRSHAICCRALCCLDVPNGFAIGKLALGSRSSSPPAIPGNRNGTT